MGFASGLRLGAQMANDAFDADMREKEAKRRQELHDLQTAQLRGLIEDQNRVRDATTRMTTLATAGVADPNAIKANDDEFEFADSLARSGLEVPKYDPKTAAKEWRAASDLELNQAQYGLAAARGDVAGMEVARKSKGELQWQEGYKKHMKDWDAMSDDDRSKLIDRLSMDNNVPGFGTWTPGKGKQAGYMTYLPPTGDPIKLNAREAAQLYALTNLMQVDPEKARTELDKVSDKTRAVAASVFAASTQAATANNTATHYANQDALGAARNGLLRAGQARANVALDKYEAGVRAAEEAAGLRQGYLEAQAGGNRDAMAIYGPLYQAAATRAMGHGLKLPDLNASKRAVDPKDYAQTIKSFVEGGLSPERAQMRADELYGLTDGDPNAALVDNLRKLEASKRAPGRAAAAPAEAPAAAPQLDAADAGMVERLRPLVQQLRQAQSQFVAVQRSGDPAAINAYRERLLAVQRAIDNASAGDNRAARILQSLSQE